MIVLYFSKLHHRRQDCLEVPQKMRVLKVLQLDLLVRHFKLRASSQSTIFVR